MQATHVPLTEIVHVNVIDEPVDAASEPVELPSESPPVPLRLLRNLSVVGSAVNPAPPDANPAAMFPVVVLVSVSAGLTLAELSPMTGVPNPDAPV